jgi:hypothetical protein
VPLIAEAKYAGLLLILKVSVSGMMAMIVTCPALETVCAAVSVLVAASISAPTSFRVSLNRSFILVLSRFSCC